MAVTDEDEERAVRRVLADVEATLGPGGEPIVRDIARWLRQLVDDPVEYFERLIDDTQQEFHDRYIDTDWPKCPLHDGRHPLWLGDGGWRCQKDGVLIAAVGDLASRVSPESSEEERRPPEVSTDCQESIFTDSRQRENLLQTTKISLIPLMVRWGPTTVQLIDGTLSALNQPASGHGQNGVPSAEVTAILAPPPALIQSSAGENWPHPPTDAAVHS